MSCPLQAQLERVEATLEGRMAQQALAAQKELAAAQVALEDQERVQVELTKATTAEAKERELVAKMEAEAALQAQGERGHAHATARAASFPAPSCARSRLIFGCTTRARFPL